MQANWIRGTICHQTQGLWFNSVHFLNDSVCNWRVDDDNVLHIIMQSQLCNTVSAIASVITIFINKLICVDFVFKCLILCVCVCVCSHVNCRGWQMQIIIHVSTKNTKAYLEESTFRNLHVRPTYRSLIKSLYTGKLCLV